MRFRPAKASPTAASPVTAALQGDGRILLGGWAKLPGTIDTDFALVRLRGGR